MYKNLSGQLIYLFAWDAANGIPKTGDAANITVNLSKDGGTSAPSSNSVAQLDATNHPGVYTLVPIQAETNCNALMVSPKSSTANIVFRPTEYRPTPLTPTLIAYLDATISSRATAATVWSYGTRTLTSFGTLVTTIWASAARTLTGIGTSGIAAEANVQTNAAAALTAYDPPTRAEATSDKNEIITEVDANETKIDSIITSIGTLIADIWAYATRTLTGIGSSGIAPAGEYDTELGAIIADLDNPDQYKADVSSLAIEANVQTNAAAALTAYDPPTRAEATSDKDEIITQVDANETKIDTLTTNLATAQVDITFIKDIEGGKWTLTETEMIFYKSDNITEVARFTITRDGDDTPIERTRS